MFFKIRPIQPEDNNSASQLILWSIKEEFGRIESGYASTDPELVDLYANYQKPKSKYWSVINVNTGELLGCGGFAQLKGTKTEEKICELQKYYLYPKIRGMGLGKKLLNTIINEAKIIGYKKIYLESLPEMTQAIALYKKSGFKILDKSMGNTGHQKKCTVFMMYEL